MKTKKKKPLKKKRTRVVHPVITPENYKEVYIQSDWWKKRRASYLKKHPKCQICGVAFGLEVHHIRYYERGKSLLYRELDKHLRTLDYHCHRKIHFYKLEKFFGDKKKEKLLKLFVPDLYQIYDVIEEKYGTKLKTI